MKKVICSIMIMCLSIVTMVTLNAKEIQGQEINGRQLMVSNYTDKKGIPIYNELWNGEESTKLIYDSRYESVSTFGTPLGVPYTQVYNHKINVRNDGTFHVYANVYIYVAVKVYFDSKGYITKVDAPQVYSFDRPDAASGTWGTPTASRTITSKVAYKINASVYLYYNGSYAFTGSYTNNT